MAAAALASAVAVTLVLGARPSSASAAAATGLIIAVRGAVLVDGETFTIGDGAGWTTTFEFDGEGG